MILREAFSGHGSGGLGLPGPTTVPGGMAVTGSPRPEMLMYFILEMILHGFFVDVTSFTDVLTCGNEFYAKNAQAVLARTPCKKRTAEIQYGQMRTCP